MATEIKMYLESNYSDGSSGTKQFTLEMLAVMHDEFHELLEYVDEQAWVKGCKKAQKLHNKLQLPGCNRWFITEDGREIKRKH